MPRVVTFTAVRHGTLAVRFLSVIVRASVTRLERYGREAPRQAMVGGLGTGGRGKEEVAKRQPFFLGFDL